MLKTIFRELKALSYDFRRTYCSTEQELKMSQDELAKIIGTSAPIIGRYDRNEIKPSIEVLKKNR